MTIDLYDFRFYSAGGLYEFTDFKVTDTNGTDMLASGKLIYSVSRFFDYKGNFQHVWGNTLDSLVYQTHRRINRFEYPFFLLRGLLEQRVLEIEWDSEASHKRNGK